MKHISIKSYVLLAMSAIVFTLWSCSKDAVVAPADDEALQAGEVIEKQPKPGIYTITKFIDTGDDETAQFNGYTFEFQADGDFIATTNTGAVFNGFWDLNGAETMMELVISGTNALEDLDDDDWEVIRITNQRIRIKAPGPDKVVFEIQ